MAISLSGGEITYFELDPLGQLLEMAKRDIEGDVTCLDLAPVPAGLQRCKCAPFPRARARAPVLARAAARRARLRALGRSAPVPPAVTDPVARFVPPAFPRFLCVGGYDNTVRVFSLEDGTQLRSVSTQAVQVRRGEGRGREGGVFVGTEGRAP